MSDGRSQAPDLGLLEEHEFLENIKNIIASPKYDSSCESKIPHACWDLNNPRINAILRRIEERMSEILQKVPDSDKELQHIKTQLHHIAHYDRKKAITIALLGAQGTGKSMLICALFEIAGLSLTGKLGGLARVLS